MTNHEVLEIINVIKISLHAILETDHPHREVTTRYVAEYNEAVSKVANFMKEKGNHKSHLLTQNCTILRRASVSQ